MKEEEINNFYVALTRPKNNLIVIYEDRLFEEKSLKEINLEDISFEKSVINDFFDCKIGEISLSNNSQKNENVIEEDLESDLFNSQSYFISSIYENEEESEKIEINDSKFLLETEEKRMIGILVHYFFENLKYGTDEEVEFSKTLCYKKYLSYFGEEKLNKIFSKENIEMFLTKDKEIFSKKWDYIYSEYVLYDYKEKKEYRIDRLMIKDNGDGTGEIYIVDFKTGGKDESQLKTYKEVLKKNFEELQNMIKIPFCLEKFMIFGLLVCLNSFLSLFTLAPLKVLIISSQSAYQFLTKQQTFQFCRFRLIKKDVITLSIIILSIVVLSNRKLDISRMYHDVRGQTDIKLYVMFGVLECAEKLCSSIGQDILNVLYESSPNRNIYRFVSFYLLSTFYLSFHAYILIYQTVSLNVAANSYSNALMTLLLSNQFAELKSSVFKKFEREGLFQITMADLTERFQLSLMLGIIALKNLLQLSVTGGLIPNSWKSWTQCSGYWIRNIC